MAASPSVPPPKDPGLRIPVRRAAALLIGDELLSGKVADQNLPALCRTLRQLGIPLVRVVVAPDDRPIIAEELNRLRRLADLVVTCGGLGPTHDDVTVEAIAAALGVEVEESPQLRELLVRHYGDRVSAEHLTMARVPAGSVLREGSGVPWPTVTNRGVWLLPGIPELFRNKLICLKEHLRGEQALHTLSVSVNIEEGALTVHINATVSAFPGMAIGSYPRLFDPEVKTKVTFDGIDPGKLAAARTYLVGRLPPASIVELESE